MVLTKKGLERVYRLDKSIEQTNPVMVFLQIRNDAEIWSASKMSFFNGV